MSIQEINIVKKFINDMSYIIQQLEQPIGKKEREKFIKQIKTLNEYASLFDEFKLEQDVSSSDDECTEPTTYNTIELFKNAYDTIKTNSLLFQYGITRTEYCESV
jgi:hypothetical protein